MRQSAIAFSAALVGLVTSAGVALATPPTFVDLSSVSGSTVSGRAKIQEHPNQGTVIKVQARGLVPGTTYSSLLHSDPVCSADSTIGTLGGFAAGEDGEGKAERAFTDLANLSSISIYDEQGLTLLACGQL